ncbi:hypothetical protein PO124_32400 [Bacillus licheniformis]|nr:hypothetical protein [Bacillus licheniformis]
MTRTAAKCCMSSIRSEDRTTSAASGQSRSLPMNTEASVLKDRNSIIEKRLSRESLFECRLHGCLERFLG